MPGVWPRVERLVREYTTHYGELYVITGSLVQQQGAEALAIVLPHILFQPGGAKAYLRVEVLGHPGRPLAPVLGVRPQAVYQAGARGREAGREWERLLR